MRRALRWLRNAIAAVIVLLLIAVATVYALSERVIRRTYDEPLVAIPIPTDSASIAEGGRLTKILGCQGCHTPTLAGQYFEDSFLIGRLAAPNLTESARKYTDAELARIIRRGVRPDRRSVLAMPSEMYAPLTDAELGKILAYIRSLPPTPGISPSVRLGPLAWLGVVTKEYEPAAVLVKSADSITAAGYFPAGAAANAQGAYLARTACPECHNLMLQGYPGDTPDLSIVAGYTPEQFAHLFRTGEALGGRELGLMTTVARSRFSQFTDEEEAALYAYLVARAGAIQAGE